MFWGNDALISLPAFFYRSNPKLQSYLATPKFIKKIIINLDLPMVSGADCITLVVLDNCEPELSFMLAELFNIFSSHWKVPSVVLQLRMLVESSTAKTIALLVVCLS